MRGHALGAPRFHGLESGVFNIHARQGPGGEPPEALTSTDHLAPKAHALFEVLPVSLDHRCSNSAARIHGGLERLIGVLRHLGTDLLGRLANEWRIT